MLPLVWRKRRKESGWEREVVKRHRRAEGRRRAPPHAGQNETGTRVGDAGRPRGRGDEGVRASQGERTGRRDGERSERGARGRWQADGRKGRVVSTLGTSSSCAQSRIRRSRLEPRFESIARARDGRYEFSRTFPFLFSLSLSTIFFSALRLRTPSYYLSLSLSISRSRSPATNLVIEIDPISNVISE